MARDWWNILEKNRFTYPAYLELLLFHIYFDWNHEAQAIKGSLVNFGLDGMLPSQALKRIWDNCTNSRLNLCWQSSCFFLRRRMSLTCKKFHVLLWKDEVVWLYWLRLAFLNPDPLKSTRECYYAYRAQFGPFHLASIHARRFYLDLVAWLTNHSVTWTLNSLRKGVGWSIMQNRWAAQFPATGVSVLTGSEALKSLWVLYHYFDGQRKDEPFVRAGLLGISEVYGQFSTFNWLPLTVFAKILHSYVKLGMVIESNSSNTRHLLDQVIEFDQVNARYICRGPFLDFLRDWIDQLNHGGIETTPEGQLLMHPLSGDYSSRSITRGIEVIASSWPNFSTDADTLVYVYRIRIKLIDALAFDLPSAQLYSRTWRIGYLDEEVDRVQGEAVIGLYPFIRVEDTPFSYTSICHGSIENPPVYMEGEFTFIPGSIAEPIGPPFQVQIARFQFQPCLIDQAEDGSIYDYFFSGIF